MIYVKVMPYNGFNYVDKLSHVFSVETSLIEMSSDLVYYVFETEAFAMYNYNFPMVKMFL